MLGNNSCKHADISAGVSLRMLPSLPLLLLLLLLPPPLFLLPPLLLLLLQDALDKIVPEGNHYRHLDEGYDDLPAHVKVG